MLPGLFSHCSKGERGLFASCSVWTSHRSGFCCRAQALGHMDFSSWGARAWLPYSMWDLPGQIERMSPALVGGFFTTAPPGKPYSSQNRSHKCFPEFCESFRKITELQRGTPGFALVPGCEVPGVC